MLQQIQHPSGAVVLRSPLLAEAGIPHAFSTRVGGVSAGIFASLNFGNPSPCENRDRPQNIRENFRRLLEAAGSPGRELVEVHQVHGGEVHLVRRGEPAHPGPSSTKADAMVTADPNRVLAIRTADCAPVLIAGTEGRHVSVVHAGWRGVIAGVVPAAVRALRQEGADTLIAAIGPCIGECAFEVGAEVVAEFHREFGTEAGLCRPAGAQAGKWLIDLKRAIDLQLRTAGVTGVDTATHCTHTDDKLFFSHRRDQGMTGRMASVISPRA
jgi:polyphenol oxidase